MLRSAPEIESFDNFPSKTSVDINNTSAKHFHLDKMQKRTFLPFILALKHVGRNTQYW